MRHQEDFLSLGESTNSALRLINYLLHELAQFNDSQINVIKGFEACDIGTLKTIVFPLLTDFFPDRNMVAIHDGLQATQHACLGISVNEL